VIAWVRGSTCIRFGREQRHVAGGLTTRGDEASELLADCVSWQWTSTVHVGYMITVVPSTTGEVKGGRELTFFHFIIVIDISSYEREAVFLILTRHELMSMPPEIDVERGHEERGRRLCHNVPKSMIPSYAMLQCHCVHLVSKISWLGPLKVDHLLHERALPEDSTDQVE